MDKLERTVELDRGEVLAALRRSKTGEATEASKGERKGQTDELRAAIQVIKRWAEDNHQWLVVLAPWGMHHYGKLSEEQVEEIIERFSAKG